MTINPYLGFDGQCEVAFTFYAKVLKGKILAMIKTSDTPMAATAPAGMKNMVMHARLEVEGTLLMGGDAPPEHVKPMQGCTINISVDTPEEADRIFTALAEGGKIQMPIAETFWAKKFGTVTDKFGTAWMVNCEKTPQ